MLKVCGIVRYSIGFLGLAIACLKLHKKEEAEKALNEANILNIENKNVWLLLVKINLDNEK